MFHSMTFWLIVLKQERSHLIFQQTKRLINLGHELEMLIIQIQQILPGTIPLCHGDAARRVNRRQ